MKYIRTKDGIYYGTPCMDFFMVDKGGYIEKRDIVKQADTIEELCDDFVVVAQQEPHGYLVFNQCNNSFKKVLFLNKNAKENETIIYGAIWTPKGLIYVAKMNDKGELELL